MAFALAIHGGCGVLPRAALSAAMEAAARDGLREALEAGGAVLREGGSALDAVTAAVVVLEDRPEFNAGHGAVYGADGGHDLDASIMDGATLMAGAVCGIRVARNPVRVARGVMATGDLLLLQGDGADAFARAHGFALVPQSYFGTAQRRRMWEEMRALAARHATAEATEAQKHGTVGAVARDRAGNLAAATSTGGYTDKPKGRVGDSPIIGAGTYADNATCAVSATGKGEFFIRKVLAHDIAARMRYRGDSLKAATDALVLHELPAMGSGAGLVAIGRDGTLVLPFNTEGMYRGWLREGEAPVAAVYRD